MFKRLSNEAIKQLGLVTYAENGDVNDVDIEGIARKAESEMLRQVVELIEARLMLKPMLENGIIVSGKTYDNAIRKLVTELKKQAETVAEVGKSTAKPTT